MINKFFLLYFFVVYFLSTISIKLLNIDGYFLSKHEINNGLIFIYYQVFIFLFFYLIGYIFIKILFKKKIQGNLVFVIKNKISQLKLNFGLILFTPFIFYFISIHLNSELGRSDNVSPVISIVNYICIIIFPFLVGLKLLTTESYSKFKKLSILYFAILLLSLVTSYRSGAISLFLFYIIIIKIKYPEHFKLTKSKFLFLVLFICSLITFGAFRNNPNSAIELIDILQASLIRVSAPELLLIIKRDITNYGYFIQNIIESFTIIIPRGIWANKPISLSEIIANEFFNNYLFRQGIIRDSYGGVAYSVIAEGYYNLGTVGVAIYGVLLGALINIASYAIKSKKIFYFLFGKAVLMNVLFVVESPQLGFNAIIQNTIICSIITILLLKYKKHDFSHIKLN